VVLLLLVLLLMLILLLMLLMLLMLLLLLLLAMLVTVFQVTSTATVEVSTAAIAARSIGSDTSTDSCDWLAVVMSDRGSSYPSMIRQRQSQYQALPTPCHPQVDGHLFRRALPLKPTCGQHL
jgi:hypothetical protein